MFEKSSKSVFLLSNGVYLGLELSNSAFSTSCLILFVLDISFEVIDGDVEGINHTLVLYELGLVGFEESHLLFEATAAFGESGDLIGFGSDGVVEPFDFLGKGSKGVFVFLNLSLNILKLDDGGLQLRISDPEIINLLSLIPQQPIEPLQLRIQYSIFPLSILILLFDKPQVGYVSLIPCDFMSEILNHPRAILNLILHIPVVLLDDSVVLNGDLEFGDFALPIVNLTQTLFQQAVQSFDFSAERGNLVLVVSQLGLKAPVSIGFSFLTGESLLPLIDLIKLHSESLVKTLDLFAC